jgi:hypothetical protein
VLGGRFLDRRVLGGRFLDGRVLGGRFLDGRVLGGRFLDGRVLGGRFLDRRVLGGRFLVGWAVGGGPTGRPAARWMAIGGPAVRWMAIGGPAVRWMAGRFLAGLVVGRGFFGGVRQVDGHYAGFEPGWRYEYLSPHLPGGSEAQRVTLFVSQREILRANAALEKSGARFHWTDFNNVFRPRPFRA